MKPGLRAKIGRRISTQIVKVEQVRLKRDGEPVFGSESIDGLSLPFDGMTNKENDTSRSL